MLFKIIYLNCHALQSIYSYYKEIHAHLRWIIFVVGIFRIWYLLWDSWWEAQIRFAWSYHFQPFLKKYHLNYINIICHNCNLCSLAVKYGIDRNDIVLGRILGAGFFGEVYEGVYKKSVRSCSDIHTFYAFLLSERTYYINLCVL